MTKAKIILAIQKIVKEHGSFDISDVKNEGKHITLVPLEKDPAKKRTIVIVRVNEDDVDTEELINDTLTDEDSIEFDDINEEVLAEVLRVAENYKVDMEKTIDRCQN